MELKYTYRSLIKLEEMAGKGINEVLNDTSLKAIAMLVAVGANTTFNKACDLIQEEIESGEGIESISTQIINAFNQSGLMGKKKATPAK